MSVTEIARRIKKARLDAGLTQKAVADILGITYQAISNYERGTNRIDTDTLSKLCNIYGIKISDLLITPAWDDDMKKAYQNASSQNQKDMYLELWGTPSELIEESNNRREPETNLLSPEEEQILFKYHRGKLLPDMTDEEITIIKKYRRLDERGKSSVLNILNHEYDSLPGEKSSTTSKKA